MRFIAPLLAALPLAAALAIYLMGLWIPIPGVDPERLDDHDGFMGGGSIRTASIFALWTGPLLVAIVHVEIARLLIPPLARWQAASARNAQVLVAITGLIALLMTLAQGNQAGCCGTCPPADWSPALPPIAGRPPC